MKMLKMSVSEIAIVSSCLMRIYTDEEARQKHLKAFLKNGIKTDALMIRTPPTTKELFRIILPCPLAIIKRLKKSPSPIKE